MKQSDEELVQLARSGDQDAYTRLYENSRGFTKNAVYRVLRQYPEAIEDVVHDSITKALVGLDKFRGEDCKFKTWLTRIAINTALMHLRAKRSPLGQAGSLEYEGEDGEQVQVDVAQEERGYRAWEARQDLEKILCQIPAGPRTVLVLRHLDGFEVNEVCEMLGASISAIKTRAHRALSIARELMEDLEKEAVPLEKRRCVECEKANRFRYADVLIDGKPLCKWCQVELSTTVPNTRAANPEQKINPFNGKTFRKRCEHCGQIFEGTSPAQKFAPGHPHISKVLRSPPDSLSGPVRPQKHSSGNGTAIQRVEQDPENQTIAIHVSSRALDSMWNALSLKDKARAFEILLSE